jgi:hypothetical protein
MLYFKKENVRNLVYVDGKNPIGFENLPGDTGVRALDESKPEDQAVLKSLNDYADKRMGGVVRISAEIYESLKKNAASAPSQPASFLNKIRLSPSPTSFNERVAPAAAPAAVAKQGIRIMDEPAPPSSIAQFRQTGIRSRPLNQPPPANQ